MKPTYLLLTAPAALLAACQPYNAETVSYSNQAGIYATAPGYGYAHCAEQACEGAKGYSVTPTHRANAAPLPYGSDYQAQPDLYAGSASQASNVRPYGGSGYRAGSGLRGTSSADFHTGFYTGLGGVLYDTEDEALFGAQARLGYAFSKYLAAEGEASLGLTSSGGTEFVEGVGDVGAETKINYQLAGFGVGRLPVTDRFTLLARGGYHTTQVKATASVGDVSESAKASEDGIAYGAGIEYALSRHNSLRLDATRYDVDGGELDTASVSFQTRF